MDVKINPASVTECLCETCANYCLACELCDRTNDEPCKNVRVKKSCDLYELLTRRGNDTCVEKGCKCATCTYVCTICKEEGRCPDSVCESEHGKESCDRWAKEFDDTDHSFPVSFLQENPRE